MIYSVDWALKANYLSILYIIMYTIYMYIERDGDREREGEVIMKARLQKGDDWI